MYCNVDYSAQYNLNDVYEGDTILPLKLVVKGVSIQEATMTISRVNYQELNEYRCITSENEVVTPSIDTAELKAGKYRYTIVFKLKNGITRTFLSGNFCIVGRSTCL